MAVRGGTRGRARSGSGAACARRQERAREHSAHLRTAVIAADRRPDRQCRHRSRSVKAEQPWAQPVHPARGSVHRRRSIDGGHGRKRLDQRNRIDRGDELDRERWQLDRVNRFDHERRQHDASEHTEHYHDDNHHDDNDADADAHAPGADVDAVLSGRARDDRLERRLNTIDPLERLSILPSKKQPLLIELGVLKGGHRVLFVVQPGTIVTGPGVSTPGPIDCAILSLALNQNEGIARQTAQGNVPVSSFTVTAIDVANDGSAAAANKARQAESATGRALLDKSTASALSLFRYDSNVGAVLDLRNLIVGGS